MKTNRFFLKSVLFCCSFFFILQNAFAKEDFFYANESYASARNKLFKEVYIDHRYTLYCKIPFDEKKKLIFPNEFDVSKVSSRVNRVEIEHVIPAEEFGSYIKQWWQGDPHCVNKENIPYKGRKCAEKTSRIFRLMQSDMYNLYPSVGSVNAIRGNFEFDDFPNYMPTLYKNCAIKTADNKVEVPDHAKGIISRIYLYFEEQYPFFQIKKEQKNLFLKWDEMFPVTQWECLRTYRIEQIQKNENKIVKNKCINKNLWPQK